MINNNWVFLKKYRCNGNRTGEREGPIIGIIIMLMKMMMMIIMKIIVIVFIASININSNNYSRMKMIMCHVFLGIQLCQGFLLGECSSNIYSNRDSSSKINSSCIVIYLSNNLNWLKSLSFDYIYLYI